MRDNRRLIGVVMGGDSAGQRDRMMAMLMDQGFATAATMRLSAWTNIRKPPSARYTSANFDPSLIIPESTPRLATASAQPLAGFTAAAPPPQALAPKSEQRVASLATAAPAQGSVAPQGGPSIGSWVIQVGSFSEPQAAQLALERAASTLADMPSVTAAVDEVQMANKTFHRARLTNLSQAQAVDGCKRLEKKKIYCSAIQVTAWNTPNAR
jgi:D-alanyl-D-alanine carboxypeptidase